MDTYGYLEALASSIAGRIFQRFPSFISEIMEIVTSIMMREREKTRDVVESIVDSEGGYLFTNDFDYIKNRTDLIPGLKSGQEQPQQARRAHDADDEDGPHHAVEVERPRRSGC